MSIRLEDEYAGRVNPANANYPDGSIKNETVPNSSNDGTPLDELWGNDIEGFKQSLLVYGGVLPNGLPDRVGASQQVQSLFKSSGLVREGYTELRAVESNQLSDKTSCLITDIGKRGFFVLDKTDTTTVDDGGITIVDADGGRWKRAVSGVVHAKWYGALGDGSTDDVTALQAAAATGLHVKLTDGGDYLTSGSIALNATGQSIFGEGIDAGLRASADIELVTASNFRNSVRGLKLLLESSVTHTKRHIQSYNATHLTVVDCHITGNSNGSSGSGIGFGDGVGGIGGSQGSVSNTVVNHGSVEVRTWDVHIVNSWVWANSKIYGVGIFGSVGNLTLSVVDILPPLTSVVGRKAGLYASGSVTQLKAIGCYFDGNASLTTGSGVLIENGTLAPLISNSHFNLLNEDAIIFDSCINAMAIGNTFFGNNASENGSTDITVRETFAQNVERLTISNNTHTQTAALVGTTGPAIKIVAGVSRSGLDITSNKIFQPGAGGGYDDIEILLEDGAFTNARHGSLANNMGARTKYMASGVETIVAAAVTKTINYDVTYSLAYIPRIDQIHTQVASGVMGPWVKTGVPPTVGNFTMGFNATHSGGNVYFSVSL